MIRTRNPQVITLRRKLSKLVQIKPINKKELSLIISKGSTSNNGGVPFLLNPPKKFVNRIFPIKYGE